MNRIIVVSRCLRSWGEEHDDGRSWGKFSFHGFYAGAEVRELRLRAPPGLVWRPDDYLIYVAVRSCAGGVLTGEALRARRLDELVCQD